MRLLTNTDRSQGAPAGLLAQFTRDERGGITLYIVLMAVLVTGLLGLVIDSSKSFVAHSNMQDFVDDVTLAAANELNGEPDSITRATNMINQMVDNDLLTKYTTVGTMGTGADNTFKVGDFYFLTGEPDSSSRTLFMESVKSLQTTDPALATHVVVTAAQQELDFGALQLVTESNYSSSDMRGQEGYRLNAWASGTLVNSDVCVQPRLSICIPSGEDPESSWTPGQQLLLSKNRGGEWATGEYGIISDISDDADETCAAYSGSEQLECLLAIDQPTGNCGPANVNFEGDATSQEFATDSEGNFVLDSDGNPILYNVDNIDVYSALNSRFGVFQPDADGNVPGYLSSSNVSLDKNHITGDPLLCDGTIDDVSSFTQSPPVDECFADATCDYISTGAITAEELDLYFELAHNMEVPDGVTTRYEAYLYEIENNLLDPEGGNSEGPRASCTPSGADIKEAKSERRVIEVALVDCTGMTDVVQTDIPAVAYADVFLTEPVDAGENFEANFDGEVVVTGSDGTQQTVVMQAGDIPNSTQGPATIGSSQNFDFYANQGLRVYGLGRNGPDLPMLFDSQNPTGGDTDLASVGFGNVLILSEDGDATDPDDHGPGGMLIFQFDVPTKVEDISFLDADQANELLLFNSKIDLTSLTDGTWTQPSDLTNTYTPDYVIDMPIVGDGAHRTIDVASSSGYQTAVSEGTIDSDGIMTLIYYMDGSGAIDGITFTNPLAPPVRKDEILVEFLEVIPDEDPRMGSYPTLVQ
ncbi:MAG: TadE/TadG family type IV pilus assembly protein [Paracoccaceae bacterium]